MTRQAFSCGRGIIVVFEKQGRFLVVSREYWHISKYGEIKLIDKDVASNIFGKIALTKDLFSHKNSPYFAKMSDPKRGPEWG